MPLAAAQPVMPRRIPVEEGPPRAMCSARSRASHPINFECTC
jgi:hypothetical protein